jgi:hypothetical protein
MLQSLILVDVLFPLDVGRRREGKKKKSFLGRRDFLRLELPCWLCCGLQLLGAIKGLFEGQSLNFFLHLMLRKLLFWLEAVRITQVWL